MRDVWRIDVPNALATQVDNVAVGQFARRPVAQVIERDHAADRPVRHLGTRGGGEEFVHRATLIGFHMSEGDPAQPLDGNDAGDRLRNQGKHAPGAGMEEQRLVGIDEELIERKAAWGRFGDTGR
jgi:hypothetical protein